jgi:hypothetical protein
MCQFTEYSVALASLTGSFTVPGSVIKLSVKTFAVNKRTHRTGAFQYVQTVDASKFPTIGKTLSVKHRTGATAR